MLEERNIRRSIMEFARSTLESPPASTGFSAWNVYSENQLRLAQKGSFTPVRPYVFLTDSYIRPAESLLPLVVVEVPLTKRRPFEIGNRRGRLSDILIHVFGRMRGERDDISSMMADVLGPPDGSATIPVYNYTSGSAVWYEDGEIGDEVDNAQVSSRRDDIRQEGSLDLWNVVSFQLRTKQ